jgi:hypothetical protein
MLIIARNRWTRVSTDKDDERNDQKNYELVLDVLPDLKRFTNEESLPVQILLGPIPNEADVLVQRKMECGAAAVSEW